MSGKQPIHPVAARRILRLSLGTALCLLFSQIVMWPLSFFAPVITLLILGLPLPALRPRQGVMFLAALMAPMVGGTLLLPVLHHARWSGIGLVALALFYSFYYTARGGNPVLGTFMTIGLTLVVTVGSVNIDFLLALMKGIALCTTVGLAFVWIAHALLPDLPAGPQAARPAPSKPPPDLAEARRNAVRSLFIVLPLALAFMFMSASPSYTVVMIKVASMGQQASADESRAMGVSLLQSTLLGGVGALLGWYLLGAWPSLVMYVLIVALAGLLFGRWIFLGAAVHPRFSMASYAFLTMLVILGPAVLQSSGDATAALYSRLALFIVIAVYGSLAVKVFDAFWPARPAGGRTAHA